MEPIFTNLDIAAIAITIPAIAVPAFPSCGHSISVNDCAIFANRETAPAIINKLAELNKVPISPLFNPNLLINVSAVSNPRIPPAAFNSWSEFMSAKVFAASAKTQTAPARAAIFPALLQDGTF